MPFVQAFFQGGQLKNFTSFFSAEYLFLFLPAILCLYALTPNRFKKYALLLVSYLFYWIVSGYLVLALFFSTLSAYGFGLLLERKKKAHQQVLKAQQDKQLKKTMKVTLQKQRRKILALAIVLHVLVLIILKYLGFLSAVVTLIFNGFNLSAGFNVPKFIIPIGLSFFTLQIISYLVDVYRDTIQADTSLARLSLFIAFFPQIIEGPIVRYQQTANQLWNVGPMVYENVLMGGQRLLYGLFKKLVIADRLNVLLRIIFYKYAEFEGSMVAIGAIAYTIQLYMEFSGSLDAVIGISQMFGVTMPENFRQPFASKTISEFWQRWHISLGTFFKDYIFYPMSLSSKMKSLTTKCRTKFGNTYGPILASALSLLVVWVCNGLWHGPAWHFLFFGVYHFFFILIENLFSPLSNRINKRVNTQSKWYRAFQITRTFIIVALGELFFRAATLDIGMAMFNHMISHFTFNTYNWDLIKLLGIDYYDVGAVIVGLIVVWTISHLKERGVSIRESIAKMPIGYRWGIWYALILAIIIFGAYGGSYIPVDPIYANF